MRQKKKKQLFLLAPPFVQKRNYAIATIAITGIFIFTSIVSFSYLIIQTRYRASEAIVTENEAEKNDRIAPFPIGVNPLHKTIVENPTVDTYLVRHTSPRSQAINSRKNWFGRTIAKLAQLNWYQNLATPSARILIIQPGERKEEIAENFGDMLGWNTDTKLEFLSNIINEKPTITEGKFFPSTYVVARGALPREVAPLVTNRFHSEVVTRYGSDVESLISLTDTLTIASMLEREAYEFEDMRLISGIIWNRLFVGMKLQIDATLQYAKADERDALWWPDVLPADKYIASPFNTYKNMGLPPAPIANPSLDSILAALNPRKTDCMYYFHDKNSEFHCATTYKEHIALLKQYYGRGK